MFSLNNGAVAMRNCGYCWPSHFTELQIISQDVMPPQHNFKANF